MKNLFGDKGNPELQARDAMRQKKWGKALEFYSKRLEENERDFALWNLVGDLHINNRSRAQAVEAWRRALEGFALEGLYENVLGIARKILRRTPEEEDVHLLLAEAYLGLEYQADCLASFRSYLKLSRHRSESDMRSLFKKILDQPIRHAHLLHELEALWKESAIEDFELEQRLLEYVKTGLEHAVSHAPAEPDEDADRPYGETGRRAAAESSEENLITLDGLDSFPEDIAMDTLSYTPPMMNVDVPPARPAPVQYEAVSGEEAEEQPTGAGRDHYDLGVVYKEMTLWDAAMAEFEQARQDKSIRARATLALAECLQESRDLQGALELLESESQQSDGSPVEQLTVIHQLGIVHELLGNLDQALNLFKTVHDRHPGYGDVETRISALQSRLENDSPAE
ncbi:MAG TPA: hypothetical protein VGL38_12580 [bacterium]|jgi:tetratricopeptide (TPR) repeat protein